MGGHRGSCGIRRAYGRLSVRMVVMALLLAACSDSAPPGDSSGGRQAAAPSAPPAAVESPKRPAESRNGGLLEDRGTRCATHRYVLAPGTTTTVSFEASLTAPAAAEIVPGDLQMLDNHWEDIGAWTSLGYCRIESEDISRSRWVVDGREFLADSRKQAREPVTTTVGDTLIVWGRDGYGIISQTTRFRGPQEVGQLAEKQIAEQLGGSTTIEYTDPDTQKTYTWIAEPRTSEPTAHVLVIELTVDTPASARETDPKALTVAAGPQQWTFELQYSDFRDVFLVTGPAEKLACLD